MPCLLIVLLALIGCERRPDLQPVFDEGASLRIDTDWPLRAKWTAVYHDPNTGRGYIYSGDPVSYRVVRVFSEKGERLHEFPLDTVLGLFGEVNSFTLIAPDSLLVLDKHGGRFAVIDTVGGIRRTANLRSGLTVDEDVYELDAPATGPIMMGRSLYLGADWLGAVNDMDDAHGPLELVWKKFFAVANRKCEVAKIDVAGGASTMRIGGCALLSELADPPRATTGGSSLALCGAYLAWYSPYIPKLILLDTATLTPARSIQVSFSGGIPFIDAPEISEEDIKAHGYNIRLQTSAYIDRVHRDLPTGYHVLTINHALPADAPARMLRSGRNWSLVVLDANFEPRGEYVFSNAEYVNGTILPLSDGMWVLESEKDPPRPHSGRRFRRLKLP